MIFIDIALQVLFCSQITCFTYGPVTEGLILFL